MLLGERDSCQIILRPFTVVTSSEVAKAKDLPQAASLVDSEVCPFDQAIGEIDRCVDVAS
jgi:hypothetical protein